jgi:aminoglycoside/choline kinase family phosphotransferase
MGLADASDSRLALLSRWVFDDLGFTGCMLAPASADASFRRYFRITRDADTYIVMDAPPDREQLGPFIRVAALLAGIGLNVPTILARDLPRGLLLLSDLGTRQYLDELPANGAADPLYGDALRALESLQLAHPDVARELPRYTEALLMGEMDLMPEWFLKRHLQIDLPAAELAALRRVFETLAQEAASQPQVIVHRDYHSRNLLVSAHHNPGIIDFQDAVWGPLTYDLVSLLKDCYIAWPAARVRAWVLGHRERLRQCGLALPGDERDFLRAFDLMGLQRHIKVLGIFARLYYRDGKPQYLKDLPRVLQYVKDTASEYPDMAPLAQLLARRIEAPFEEAQQRVRASEVRE